MAIHFDTQGPAPDGFHVPTKDEWVAINNTGISLGAWASNGKNDFKKYLKLPLAGIRPAADGDAYGQGNYAEYWSSSPSTSANSSYYLLLENGISPTAGQQRGYAMSVRPFKNATVIPDGGRTILYQGSGNAGIYHNSALGLISISSDGTNWITIADKNLGATTVYNDGDTLSAANCGNYYQRGNNYGFPRTGSITKSSTKVDASTYGPGNYYESSTFITGNYYWETSDSGNLWGGVSQGTWGTPEYRLHGAIQTFHRAPKAPTSITLNEGAIIFSAVGDTQQLTATVSPDDASKDLIWSSDDTSIATVSNTGLVTCVSLGNCVITCSAKYGSATASCNVIKTENVTMTSTTCRGGSPNGDTQDALFTAQRTGYYHITGQGYNQTTNGSTVIWISGGTNISGTDYIYTTNYETNNIDCVREITAGTVVYGNGQRWSSGIGGGRNFAAVYYGSYDPTPDLYPDA